MNTLIVELFSTPLAQRVAWAIVHFLWQGLAVALALAIALRLLRNRQPQLRWAAACLALALMAVLPVATALRVAVSHTPPATSSLPPELNLRIAPQPPSPTYAAYSPPSANASSPDPAPSPANPKPPPPAFQPPYDLLRPALPWVLLAWLAGVFGMSLWHLGGWTLLQWTRRQCTNLTGPDLLALFQPLLQRLNVRRPVRLLQSSRIAVPAVVGYLRPAILLPVSLLSGLTPRQLEAVLAHEIAHILRNDYLISLIQAAVETLLFYHPAVWWVSARIRQEAEFCCDQQALRACPCPQDYAQALARVADLTRTHPHLAPAATGGKLLPRVRRVLGLNLAPARFSTRWLAAILALSLLICGVAANLPTHVAANPPTIQAAQLDTPSPIREAATLAAVDPSPANTLQTKISFKRKGPVFHRDEPIEPNVWLKNTSDRPVRYDARQIDLAHKGTWTLFAVVGPDGKPAPNIAAHAQVGARQAKYDYPTLAPGQQIEIDAVRLDMRYYYMGKPGKYRITWPGTQLAPPDPDLLSGQGPKAWDAALYQAQKIASGLPPADPVEITVRAPDDPQDVDAVGRVLNVLPPGWKINGASLSASGPRPGGPQPGHAWRISLLHSPVPGVLDNLALMDLLFSSQPASREDWEYLGRGRLGHVYLTLQHAAPLNRWHHATYDLAVALDVADPPPKQPPGPDWGRMVCHVMAGCAAERRQADSLARFCRSAELTDGQDGKPLISYAENLIPATKTKPAARQHPDRPYYEVALSVRPIDRPSQLKLAESDAFIRWDRQSSVYGVEVNRLNVEIVITVRSDDPDFAQRLNAIFNREITRVLMDTKTAASIKPAVGARIDRAEVIRIATRKAEDSSRDLINYAAPRVSFDPQTKRWTLLFDGIVDPAPGNHFSVFVDDQTAAATLAPGRSPFRPR